MTRFSSRYEKVKRLAEESPHEGEREAAKAAMERMVNARKPMDPNMKINFVFHLGLHVQRTDIHIVNIT